MAFNDDEVGVHTDLDANSYVGNFAITYITLLLLLHIHFKQLPEIAARKQLKNKILVQIACRTKLNYYLICK